MSVTPRPGISLGLRANAGQFALLVGVNALVGGLVGQERVVLPLLASEVFGLTAASTALTFLIAFGVAKAVTNLVAGALADRFGRKPVLVAGWVVGLPVPILLIVAPDWSWVVAANLLLGVNQGLTWSTTVLMKIDLVGPRRRGLALGLNEASGYVAVAAAALVTGLVAESAGLRPAPFLIGIAIAGLGLGSSVLFVRETRHHVAVETSAISEAAAISVATAASPAGPGSIASAGPGSVASVASPAEPSAWRQLAWRTTVADPSLSAASQAGLVNNLNDALAWGLLPIVHAAAGLPLGQIAVLAAIYPATWGLLQIATGALSDRIGRRRLIVAGMLSQAVAIASIVAWTGFLPWLFAAIVLGLGTAMVYPTLIAVVADVAEPRHRGAVVGIYRFWRDLGIAIGAVLIGIVANAFGATTAILVVAAVTAGSGLLVAIRMAETRPAE